MVNALTDTQAERAALHSMLTSKDAREIGFTLLNEQTFSNPMYADMYESMYRMHTCGMDVDVVTMYPLVPRDIMEAVIASPAFAPNMDTYARVIKECWIRREMTSLAGKVIENAKSGNVKATEQLAEAQEKLNSLLSGLHEKKMIIDPMRGAAQMKDIVSHLKENGGLAGLMTGFYITDYYVNGFKKGDLVLIGARPGVGKTALALNICSRLALQKNIPVAFVSLEMTWQQLVFRLASSYTGIDAKALEKGEVSYAQIDKTMNFLDLYAKSNLIITDLSGIRLQELRQLGRDLVKQYGVKEIFIDYVQLIDAPGPTLYAQNTVTSKNLKAMAKELDLPVVALAQLNRGVEARQDKRPYMHDIKESGQYEQDVDTGLFMFREEITELICRKQRNGSPFTEKLTYNGKTYTFESLQKEPDTPYNYYMEAE